MAFGPAAPATTNTPAIPVNLITGMLPSYINVSRILPQQLAQVPSTQPKFDLAGTVRTNVTIVNK